MPVNRSAKTEKSGERICQDSQKPSSLILNLLLQMSAGVPHSIQMRAELGKPELFETLCKKAPGQIHSVLSLS